MCVCLCANVSVCFLMTLMKPALSTTLAAFRRQEVMVFQITQYGNWQSALFRYSSDLHGELWEKLPESVFAVLGLVGPSTPTPDEALL